MRDAAPASRLTGMVPSGMGPYSTVPPDMDMWYVPLDVPFSPVESSPNDHQKGITWAYSLGGAASGGSLIFYLDCGMS